MNGIKICFWISIQYIRGIFDYLEIDNNKFSTTHNKFAFFQSPIKDQEKRTTTWKELGHWMNFDERVISLTLKTKRYRYLLKLNKNIPEMS